MTGVELAVIGGHSVTLGQVMMAGGALMTAAGAARQADATAGAAEYNADMARKEAGAEEARRRTESQRQLAAMRAGRAKSGVAVEGTPLMVAAESAELAEIDALSARWSGETSARLDESRAASARKSKPYTVGASLLTGAAQIGARTIS